MNVSRAQLKRYAEALAMWHSRFDSWEIAKRLQLEESLVVRWIAHYKDLMHGAATAEGVSP